MIILLARLIFDAFEVSPLLSILHCRVQLLPPFWVIEYDRVPLAALLIAKRKQLNNPLHNWTIKLLNDSNVRQPVGLIRVQWSQKGGR